MHDIGLGYNTKSSLALQVTVLLTLGLLRFGFLSFHTCCKHMQNTPTGKKERSLAMLTSCLYVFVWVNPPWLSQSVAFFAWRVNSQRLKTERETQYFSLVQDPGTNGSTLVTCIRPIGRTCCGFRYCCKNDFWVRPHFCGFFGGGYLCSDIGVAPKVIDPLT